MLHKTIYKEMCSPPTEGLVFVTMDIQTWSKRFRSCHIDRMFCVSSLCSEEQSDYGRSVKSQR